MNGNTLHPSLDSQNTWLPQLVQSWKEDLAAEVSIVPAAQMAGEAHDCLAEPIVLNGERIGWLKLANPAGNRLALRLKSDAQMVSKLIQQEYEIENMTTELIDQQDQLMALHHLAEATRIQVDFEQTLSALTAVAARLLKTEGAFMQLSVADQEPHFAAYPKEEWAVALWQRLLQNFDTHSTKKQWLLQQGDRTLQQLGVPIRNLLMKKVRVRSHVSFVLGVVNKLSGNFHTPDIKLLSTIAEPAGASLENALLQRELLDQTRIQTEMELAKQIQTRLLPRHVPAIQGIDLAVQSRPAFQVGGDFYDFVIDKDGLLTCVVGDVSGKGMPAALLMTMMRTVLRGKTLEITVTAPEQILAYANRHLYSDFSEVDMFATVFVCQYSTSENRLYYANQGHSPVIYRPKGEKARLLKADAPPLAILPESLAERHSIHFFPGDLIVIASDGFSDAERPNGVMFGYERLLQRIDALATLSAADLQAQLFREVQEFAEGHLQSDDQTLLVLKRE